MTDFTIIPEVHKGLAYFEVMADISAKRSTKRYLEIGINTGQLLRYISTKYGICVDPSFNLSENIMLQKGALHLHQVTSDAFFADPEAVATIGGPIDLAFLDGMHTFEFLLRDFYNTESLSGRGGLIGLHDCLPLNAEMAHRDFSHSLEIGKATNHPDFWTGDVWKVVRILQKYRPDLSIVCVECPPTGIVFVSNLDPDNRILQDRYLEIVKEFNALPNSLDEIRKLYESVTLVPADKIVNDFDHTLYFKI